MERGLTSFCRSCIMEGRIERTPTIILTGVGWGRLGVCGSAVVPACVVSGWLWSCRVWNTIELVA